MAFRPCPLKFIKCTRRTHECAWFRYVVSASWASLVPRFTYKRAFRPRSRHALEYGYGQPRGSPLTTSAGDGGIKLGIRHVRFALLWKALACSRMPGPLEPRPILSSLKTPLPKEQRLEESSAKQITQDTHVLVVPQCSEASV